MTQAFNFETWDQLIKKVSELQSAQTGNEHLMPHLRFRGQSNASWKLATTLERSGRDPKMRFADYYKLILDVQSEIEAFTGNRWQLPNRHEVYEAAREYEYLALDQDLHSSMYGYMAHLRHHGFPSPLLDWTRSVHIAAYFAFAHASIDSPASIYVLSEARMHSGSAHHPTIHTLGPNVRTHRRHFLQQCEYTLCAQFDDEWRFADHDSSFESRGEDEEVPVNSAIYKLNIAGSEKLNVLRLLDAMNLNAFSLFGSEESLMETLSQRDLLRSS